MKKLLIAPILLVIAIAVSAATIEVPEAPAFMLIAGGGVEDGGAWFGNTAEDRSSSFGEGYTFIDKHFTSPSTGLVTSIKVFAAGAAAAEFACFQDDGSTYYTSIGNSESVNLSAGLQTLQAPADFTAFACNEGNYIGAFFSSGNVDHDVGSATLIYIDADRVPTTGSDLFTSGAAKNAASIEFFVE